MGDIVMGKYHFGLSSWNYKLERTRVLDFAIYSNDRDVSIVIPNPPAFDPEVLTRCFTDEVWAVTGLFLRISCALICYFAEALGCIQAEICNDLLYQLRRNIV